MALTPLRWIAGAIVGCLSMAVLILRADAPRQIERDALWQVRQVLDRHGEHASNAARRLHVVNLLDSLGGVTRPPAAGTRVGSLRLFRDAALPAQLADSMLALTQRAARQLPDSSGTGTDVVFVYDTLSRLHGAAIGRSWTQVDYLLPRSVGERCVAVVHVGVEATAKRPLASLPTDAAAQRLLGPCAYYQAFGLPGRQVDAWLRLRGWSFAGDGSWDRASDGSLLDAITGPGELRILRAMFGETTLPFLYDMRLDGTQCAAGDALACDQTLFTRQAYRMPTVLNGDILFGTYPALTSGLDWYPRRSLGRFEGSLLASMVHTLGRERFARFWRSDEPVPAAFKHAAGQPIEQWATSWARTTYGVVPQRGAGVGLPSAIVSLVVIALTLLVGMTVSERRQFA